MITKHHRCTNKNGPTWCLISGLIETGVNGKGGRKGWLKKKKGKMGGGLGPVMNKGPLDSEPYDGKPPFG